MTSHAVRSNLKKRLAKKARMLGRVQAGPRRIPVPAVKNEAQKETSK